MTQTLFKIVRSFGYALEGVATAFTERNMRVHGVASVAAVSLGLFVQLQISEWLQVFQLIAMVWAAEMINTAIEELGNIVRDELHLSYVATKRARDLAAGAVYVIALYAAFSGGMIFLPKLLDFFITQ